MLDFLHKRADGIALIIMVCHRAPEPSTHHRLRDSKRRFMDGFQNFQVTYKELYELLELVKEPLHQPGWRVHKMEEEPRRRGVKGRSQKEGLKEAESRRRD
ncbi:hypothetical protein EB796_006377 [Bugula neritina]|uniref:Uncharacterized protein n=1 Tax=Bugula neritina TaxID=10212 RepID=A0A7J7KCJ6_BUGNE|nr:hypothetical protein EB796_006377 [Bugula neritina]